MLGPKAASTPESATMSTKRKAILAAANASADGTETPPSKRRKLPVSAPHYDRCRDYSRGGE